MTSTPAIGRLAPTPSGMLHLGNARSFLLAWLWARQCGGRLIMRVEDIDRDRVKPGLRDQALADIAWLGLDWDDGPRAGDSPGEFDQSERIGLYRQYLQTLIAAGRAYPCVCSRKDIELATSAPHGDEGPVYPGTCRRRFADAAQAERQTGIKPCWRYAFEPADWCFKDEILGNVSAHSDTLGDFVLWRRDGLPSYQLAVAVDDALMGVTQVMRGQDLALSTIRQLALQKDLGLRSPRQWAHVPLMRAEDGRRLAKRDGDLSLRALQERRVLSQQVIGLCAYSCGLTSDSSAIEAVELIGRLDFKQLVEKPVQEMLQKMWQS